MVKKNSPNIDHCGTPNDAHKKVEMPVLTGIDCFQS